jgi:hypothetical protein
MALITRKGLEACLAFGTAALAIAEVAELVGDRASESTRELLVELEAAHDRLRAAFDLGRDDIVHTLGLSVLVLAERTKRAIQEPGDLTDS